ncbi:GNAT family N-acetyltransferase [Vitreimonas flagellata]|uniref:GNAT family N-acetyltransferase n=1 Tax=Vitreimonas flagellata TaxID=2560861 RepID=UPI001074BDEA|nr:GNAT family N-acetyltransferase [Vitreimonas flagellata]
MPEIVLADEPKAEHREAILDGLRVYNEAQVGPSGSRLLALLLRDDAGKIIGGLWGRSGYDWLFIELLHVPESLRGGGYGAALMARAEEEARARGCHGVWLDTYDFQAKPFYERLGYVEFGAIDDYPRGHKRHFMRKSLSACNSPPSRESA